MTPLTSHGLSHPALKAWISTGNWQAIADWYAATPEARMEELMSWMSFADMSRFYGDQSFQSWYSELCAKIAANEHLHPVFSYGDTEIREMARRVILSVNEHREAANPFTIVIQNLFRRSVNGSESTKSALFYLLICLITGGTIEPYTGLLFFVEMSPHPRWATLGLPSPPTAIECQAALSS